MYFFYNGTYSQSIITTIGGNGECWLNDAFAYYGDSAMATNVTICEPSDMAIDDTGNVYVCDYLNSIIYKIKTSGIMITLAGVPGSIPYNGDNIKADTAHLSNPVGIIIDKKGNIIFCDEGNFRIRKIDLNGFITTICGNGIQGFSVIMDQLQMLR